MKDRQKKKERKEKSNKRALITNLGFVAVGAEVSHASRRVGVAAAVAQRVVHGIHAAAAITTIAGGKDVDRKSFRGRRTAVGKGCLAGVVRQRHPGPEGDDKGRLVEGNRNWIHKETSEPKREQSSVTGTPH